ncbi:MAG: lysylphosphatidylglycerol synthase transmembrane domain-containing protein [Candidatus Omnitrophota bacterium]
MKNKIFALMRVGVSLSLLGLLIWLMRDEFSQIKETLLASNFLFILAAVCLFNITVSVISYRMKIVFEGENLDLSIWESIQLTYIGYFFNNFMPTAVGGDVVKAHYATQTNQKRMQSYASVLMDRLIGLYSFLIIAAIALAINWQSFRIPLARNMIFLFLGLGVVGFLIITNKTVESILQRFFKRIKMRQLGEKLEELYSIVHDYRNRLDVIGKALLISIFAQSTYFVVIYMFFRSLGLDTGIGNIFLIMPVVTFISMFPSLGGLGVREGAMVALFAPLTGKDNAFAASLLLLFLLFLVSLIGGIIYFWWGVSARRKESVQ